MKRLLKYLADYKKESVLAPLFKLFEALLDLLVPVVVAAIIDRGINGGGGTGVIVRYANLSMLYAIRAGDPVRAGQTIGFIGRTMPEESNLPAHLHLRIVDGDTTVDPEKVLQTGILPHP